MRHTGKHCLLFQGYLEEFILTKGSRRKTMALENTLQRLCKSEQREAKEKGKVWAFDFCYRRFVRGNFAISDCSWQVTCKTLVKSQIPGFRKVRQIFFLLYNEVCKVSAWPCQPYITKYRWLLKSLPGGYTDPSMEKEHMHVFLSCSPSLFLSNINSSIPQWKQ